VFDGWLFCFLQRAVVFYLFLLYNNSLDELFSVFSDFCFYDFGRSGFEKTVSKYRGVASVHTGGVLEHKV